MNLLSRTLASLGVAATLSSTPAAMAQTPAAELCAGRFAAQTGAVLQSPVSGRRFSAEANTAYLACQSFAKDYPTLAAAVERRGKIIISEPTEISFLYALMKEVGREDLQTADVVGSKVHHDLQEELFPGWADDALLPGFNDPHIAKSRFLELVDLVAKIPDRELNILRQDYSSGIIPLMAEQAVNERNATYMSWTGSIFTILIMVGVSKLEQLYYRRRARRQMENVRPGATKT